MKPKNLADSVNKLTEEADDKMRKIVDEVDRFFKSVHADIEDWKFSMEDLGDGTRIFVRFQIHINGSEVPPNPKRSNNPEPGPGKAKDRLDGRSLRGGRAPPDEPEVTKDVPEVKGTGAARQADLDLASFVELWRRKRGTSAGGEYHKDGAPYMDARSEWNGDKRSSGDSSPDEAGERADGEPKVPDAPP